MDTDTESSPHASGQTPPARVGSQTPIAGKIVPEGTSPTTMARRFGLFPKYAAALMALVGGALITSGLIEMALSYRATVEATGELQRSEVRTAAVRIEQYLGSIRSQVDDVSSLPWDRGLLGSSDRRDEFQRLLKLVPAISQLTLVGADGRERIRVSRVQLDEIDGMRDARGNANVEEARRHGIFFSPTYFRQGSEPNLTLATVDRQGDGSVTLAELNLRFVGDVVRQIRVGRGGNVYVVDSANHLVAHPDASLVMRKNDLSAYEPLQRLRAVSGTGVMGMIEAIGLDGGPVMLSSASIPLAGWLVVVEQPQAEVLAPLYATMTRTALLMVAGLLAAMLVAFGLARRLSRPIVQVQRGARRLADGDLSTRIKVKTGDEVEALASEFNRMADQLQDYTTGLERKVAEKTAELESANRHKSEFLANMSHELRTPLNAVIGFSDVLKEKMFGELNEKQMEYVGDIHSSGQHLLSLINDILDLSKIEAGRMELDPHAFDVGAALENCRTLIRERARGRGLRLTFGVPAELGLWSGDERKFKQIVLNLLSNAVKFTPRGGEVRLGARLDPESLVISVSDTGPGIAPEDHEAIFDSFRQLKQGADARHEGTGLGLTLTKRLVELHGGAIRVESAKGKGATFVVHFPRARVAVVHE
jgi:signal transduction histidine kinase